MRRYLLSLSVFLLPLALFACVGGEVTLPLQEPQQEETEEPAPSIIQEEDLVTYNVTYTGILEEGGVTIYQQGTHRLMLSDGKMVLLDPAEETAIVLNLYVGKLVRIKGDVMPTVEAGGTIMEVQEIGWIRRETNEEGDEVEVIRMLCGGEGGSACPLGYVCELGEEEKSSVCVEGEGSEGSEGSEGGEGDEIDDEDVDVDEGEEDVEEDAEAESGCNNPCTDAQECSGLGECAIVGEQCMCPGTYVCLAGCCSWVLESADSSECSAEGEANAGESGTSALLVQDDEEPAAGEDVPEDLATTIASMEEEDYAAGRWTQEYCSAHVGFCVSVHKNWYFKSFGATASLLWHVEMGAAEVADFGEGPLMVDLKTGAVETLGVADGDVQVVGAKVIGYRSWSDNRHFEISAPASLVEPVTYVTVNLRGKH